MWIDIFSALCIIVHTNVSTKQQIMSVKVNSRCQICYKHHFSTVRSIVMVYSMSSSLLHTCSALASICCEPITWYTLLVRGCYEPITWYTLLVRGCYEPITWYTLLVRGCILVLHMFNVHYPAPTFSKVKFATKYAIRHDYSADF